MLLATADDFGHHAIENPLKFHNLHATMMHLLAVQPETPPSTMTVVRCDYPM